MQNTDKGDYMDSKHKIAEIDKAIEKTDKALSKLQSEIRKRKWQAAIKQNQLEACSKLSADERRKVDEILKQYNQRQRKRYGIGSDLTGYEFR